MTNILLDKGLRHIALIRGAPNLLITYDQEQGVRQALAAKSLTLNEDMIFDSDFKYNGGYVATQQLLAKKLPVSAIIAANDAVASGVIAALGKHKLLVPDDVSVVSLDSVEGLNDFNHLSLVTANVPDMEIGDAACKQILRLIDGEIEQAQDVFCMKMISGKTV